MPRRAIRRALSISMEIALASLISANQFLPSVANRIRSNGLISAVPRGAAASVSPLVVPASRVPVSAERNQSSADLVEARGRAETWERVV